MGTAFIIWNELVMSNRHNPEAVDRSLQEVRRSKLPCEGAVVLSLGDFGQIFRVVRAGNDLK